MKKKIKVNIERERSYLLSNIVFSQVPAYFGNTSRPLTLSLILPQKTDKTSPMPLIIWLCGGGWELVDKDAWIPELLAYSEQGYAVASIEYRISSEAKFPAQIEDTKTAIRYMRAHAEKYNIDPNKIGIMGESAGAFLASLAGTTGGFSEFDKGEWIEQSSSVQAVVDWYGPTDLIERSKNPINPNACPYTSCEALLIGGPISENLEKANRANPMTYISSNTPPFLILHGDQDDDVAFNQSEIFYEALTKAGVETTFYQVEGAGHVADEFVQPEIQKIILGFLDKHLK